MKGLVWFKRVLARGRMIPTVRVGGLHKNRFALRNYSLLRTELHWLVLLLELSITLSLTSASSYARLPCSSIR